MPIRFRSIARRYATRQDPGHNRVPVLVKGLRIIDDTAGELRTCGIESVVDSG
jgi:hypothetical protein